MQQAQQLKMPLPDGRTYEILLPMPNMADNVQIQLDTIAKIMFNVLSELVSARAERERAAAISQANLQRLAQQQQAQQNGHRNDIKPYRPRDEHKGP
jgi:hypothetical protein